MLRVLEVFNSTYNTLYNLYNPSLKRYENSINGNINYLIIGGMMLSLSIPLAIPGIVISICAAVKNSGILKINPSLNTPNGLLIASAILSFFLSLNIIAAILLFIANSKLAKPKADVELKNKDTWKTWAKIMVTINSKILHINFIRIHHSYHMNQTIIQIINEIKIIQIIMDKIIQIIQIIKRQIKILMVKIIIHKIQTHMMIKSKK